MGEFVEDALRNARHLNRFPFAHARTLDRSSDIFGASEPGGRHRRRATGMWPDESACMPSCGGHGRGAVSVSTTAAVTARTTSCGKGGPSRVRILTLNDYSAHHRHVLTVLPRMDGAARLARFRSRGSDLQTTPPGLR